MSVAKRILLVTSIAAVAVFAGASLAFAAPTLNPGQGWPDYHGSYPGYCLNCHNGFAVWPAPAITQGATPTHRDRGSTCGQCHTVNTPPPVMRVPVTYMKGANRYLTAIDVSKKTFTAGAPAVVLATGANFPDALAAAPLAKGFGGPILLVPFSSTLNPDVAAEITRLHPAQVFIIGSESAVTAGVENAVKAMSWAPAVTRLGGANRYETARLVAASVVAKAGTPAKVVIASGRNYPDALAIAPLAAAKGWPILLTDPAYLPSTTASAVAECGATGSIIVGGEPSVSATVAAMLPSPMRLAKAGGNRYDTCAEVAKYAVAQGMTYGTIATTVGTNYPDALAAGPMVAMRNGILLLTPPTGALPTSISSLMTANKMSCNSMVVVGGALSSTQVTSIGTLLN